MSKAKSNDLLFEIGCEELPSLLVYSLSQNLTKNIINEFNKAQLSYDTIQSFASPRRLAILVKHLSTQQPAQNITRRGPAITAAYDQNGIPTTALLRFAKSCQIELSVLTTLTTDKGSWVSYQENITGISTKDIIAELIINAINALPKEKFMRFADGTKEFIRPVHWLVLLYSDEIIPCNFLGIHSDRCTYGHRFHTPQAVSLQHPQDYESVLLKAYVIVDFQKRQQNILEQLQLLAAKYHAKVNIIPELLHEVTAIVEWPQALLANFQPSFLEMPSEVIITTMQVHQKCFALYDEHENLLPYFITIANIASHTPQNIIHGNEKVIHARLNDAAFFWQQDRKQPLINHIEATRDVIFQNKLGSVYDKTQRLQQLIQCLIVPLQLIPDETARVVMLSKCDLMTQMVNEFPELQGLMGYYYAQNDHETENTAIALREQYYPRFAEDRLPQSNLGIALSLVDRIDTIVGIFLLQQKPSGVKDPFKLRRHALAIARILITNDIGSLRAVLSTAIKIYEYNLHLTASDGLIAILQEFILERLQSFYINKQHIDVNLFNAVCALQPDNFYDLHQRLLALVKFMQLPQAVDLIASCKRVHNLISKQIFNINDAIKPELFQEHSEKILFNALIILEQEVLIYYQAKNYQGLFIELLTIINPLNEFFNNVMILADDPLLRYNRLLMLQYVYKLLNCIAKFI